MSSGPLGPMFTISQLLVFSLYGKDKYILYWHVVKTLLLQVKQPAGHEKTSLVYSVLQYW